MATLTAAGVDFSDGSTINGTVLNSIGSYIFALPANGVNIGSTLNYNQTTAGSNLRVISAGYDSCSGYYNLGGLINPSLSGTWRNLGGAIAGYGAAFLWVRIS